MEGGFFKVGIINTERKQQLSLEAEGKIISVENWEKLEMLDLLKLIRVKWLDKNSAF